jgi:hypothetical protein
MISSDVQLSQGYGKRGDLVCNATLSGQSNRAEAANDDLSTGYWQRCLHEG